MISRKKKKEQNTLCFPMKSLNLDYHQNIIFITMCYRHRKKKCKLSSLGWIFSLRSTGSLQYKYCPKHLSLNPRLAANYQEIQDELGCNQRKLTFSFEKEILVKHKEIIEVIFHICSFLDNGGLLRLIQVLQYETIYQ